MKITEVRIYPIKSKKSATKAFASVTFDECFVVTGFRVVKGKKGLFVSMPQTLTKKDDEEEYIDTAYPITKEYREELIERILKEYEEA